jgi:phage shock protein C
MQTVKQISLGGHTVMFRLNEDAYNILSQYLERARLRLKADPDHEDVMRDLELSIGEKLAALLSSMDQVISAANVNAVLAQVGPVETGSASPITAHQIPRGKRKLCRIQEGQDIFGVCQGLAAYSDIQVDWVRTIFVLLTLVTGGAFGLVYLAMAFLVPAVPTRADYIAAHTAPVNAA